MIENNEKKLLHIVYFLQSLTLHKFVIEQASIYNLLTIQYLKYEVFIVILLINCLILLFKLTYALINII